MAHIHSFAPIGNADARVLILGSMPGRRSLEANQYYAHPQNSFWRIMGDLFGAPPHLSYPDRQLILKSRGIAVWDVLAVCERGKSSLDAAISKEVANDFATFFKKHPLITQVYFNGSKAEQCFRKLVLGKHPLPPLTLQRLPSTSPAHAGIRYEEKLQAWRTINSLL